MSGQLHYEVFLKKNRKAGWALFEAVEERDNAIKLASGLLAKHKDGSVRVTKERFDPETRAFRSVPIFEKGREDFQKEVEKTAEASLPCYAPDDLSSSHARETIRRVLGDWLERKTVLPMELLHRPDLVELLEASNSELQHAVQKVAVASARDSEASVHGYVKQLNELVQRSLTRIYQDGRQGRLPQYSKRDKFREVALAIHADDSRPYKLRAAIADRLRSETSMARKVAILLDMADDLPGDENVREFALAEIDAFLSETISFDAGREAIIGRCADLGELVERLACLFDGDEGADVIRDAPDTAQRVAELVAKGRLDACKTVIAKQLLKEMQRPGRLRPSSLHQEIRLARELAQKLVMSTDALMPREELAIAFQARSSRLLQAETIDELLRGASDPREELDRLLDLEENLVGEENRRKLAGYLRSILRAHQTENHFLRGEGTPLERLAALTALQAKVFTGKYAESDRAELVQALDQMGMKLIDESKILNSVEAGDRPALDKAEAMLKLISAGALPTGNCSHDAHARALRLIKSNMGLSEAQTEDAKDKLRSIQRMLHAVSHRLQAA